MFIYDGQKKYCHYAMYYQYSHMMSLKQKAEASIYWSGLSSVICLCVRIFLHVHPLLPLVCKVAVEQPGAER